MLYLHRKSCSEIVCLVNDNVSTKKARANRKGLPVVGCASYRFNFAMREILREKQEVIDKANSTILKLCRF